MVSAPWPLWKQWARLGLRSCLRTIKIYFIDQIVQLLIYISQFLFLTIVSSMTLDVEELFENVLVTKEALPDYLCELVTVKHLHNYWIACSISEKFKKTYCPFFWLNSQCELRLAREFEHHAPNLWAQEARSLYLAPDTHSSSSQGHQVRIAGTHRSFPEGQIYRL